MSIIEKQTKIGKLFVSNKTYKMALEVNGEVISDQASVMKILEEHRIPIKAQIEITQRCNYNCYYCFEKSLRDRKDMSLEEVKQVIDKLDELGVVFLDITGGEPLQRPDILEIFKYINQKNFIISIITNGSKMTDEIAEELSKGCVSSIRLSLLAAKPETNDLLTRVSGSYQMTMNAVRVMQKYHLPFDLTSVITNQNIDQYEDYKRMEKEYSIRVLYGVSAAAAITGYEEIKDYELKDSHIEKIRRFIGTVKDKSKDEHVEFNCSGAKSKLGIDNQGNVLACQKLRTILGNFLTQDFDEIWNSDIAKQVIETELVRPEKCQKCEKKNYCEAYCPAVNRYYEDEESKCYAANLLAEVMNG